MRQLVQVSFVLLVLMATGCNGTLEIGIERSPTPDADLFTKVAVLKAENAQLATRIAEQVTPVPTPTPPPRLGSLAYVYGGDIWVKTLPADTPKRLTTDGRNSEPRWSPSGHWLAFRKERPVTVEVPCDMPLQRTRVCLDSMSVIQKQVWVMEADSAGMHPVGQGASVNAFAWSPVDDRLAFTTDTEGLSTISADGTDLVNLVSHSARNGETAGRVGRFAWSPDGTLIVYEWRVPSSQSSPGYQGLRKVSRDGKKQAELYASNLAKQGEALLAGWSPLAKRVMFWQTQSLDTTLTDGAPLYSVSADQDASKGSALPKLESETAVLVFGDFVAPAPYKSSSLVTDAMAMVTGANRSTWKNKHVTVDGKLLSPSDLAALSPAWAPNGLRLAFSAMPDGADLASGELVRQELMQRHIWLVSVIGEPRLQRLTDGAYRDERPLWSADGRYLLFARMDSRDRTSLWIVSADGTNIRQVVEELTPAPDPIGLYGHVEWDVLFDWWRGN